MRLPHELQRRLEARDHGFRWRGGEGSRIEALSDAAFGVALALLVVPLDAPRGFEELERAMRGIAAALLGAAPIFLAWYRQYLWFRRYGLSDGVGIVLHLALLVLVLGCIVPLRFLGGRPTLTGPQWAVMMVGTGAAVVCAALVFALLHRHALRLRESLELDELEEALTRRELRLDLLVMATGGASVALAALGEPGRAGLVYLALLPLAAWEFRVRGQAMQSALAGTQVDGDFEAPRLVIEK